MFFQIPEYKWPDPAIFFEQKITVNDYELDDHDRLILTEVEDCINEYYNEQRREDSDTSVINFFSDDTILEMAELLSRICNKNG